MLEASDSFFRPTRSLKGASSREQKRWALLDGWLCGKNLKGALPLARIRQTLSAKSQRFGPQGALRMPPGEVRELPRGLARLSSGPQGRSAIKIREVGQGRCCHGRALQVVLGVGIALRLIFPVAQHKVGKRLPDGGIGRCRVSPQSYPAARLLSLKRQRAQLRAGRRSSLRGSSPGREGRTAEEGHQKDFVPKSHTEGPGYSPPSAGASFAARVLTNSS